MSYAPPTMLAPRGEMSPALAGTLGQIRRPTSEADYATFTAQEREDYEALYAYEQAAGIQQARDVQRVNLTRGLTVAGLAGVALSLWFWLT